MDGHAFYASGFNVEKLVNQGDTQEAERQIREQLALSESEQNQRASATGAHALGHRRKRGKEGQWANTLPNL